MCPPGASGGCLMDSKAFLGGSETRVTLSCILDIMLRQWDVDTFTCSCLFVHVYSCILIHLSVHENKPN